MRACGVKASASACRFLALTLGWCLASCASPGPQDTLRAYRDALQRGDAAELRALSDEDFREQWSEERLERWLKKNPRLLDEAARRFDGARGQLREEAISCSSEGGDCVRLARTSDGWKVAEGGVLVARFDTPEAALETFFFAATGHLGLLRKLIPESEQARYASDFALGKRLYAQRERIFRARDALGPIRGGMAIVDGMRAHIPYGEGLAVELRLEKGRWRVLDLE